MGKKTVYKVKYKTLFIILVLWLASIIFLFNPFERIPLTPTETKSITDENNSTTSIAYFRVSEDEVFKPDLKTALRNILNVPFDIRWYEICFENNVLVNSSIRGDISTEVNVTIDLNGEKITIPYDQTKCKVIKFNTDFTYGRAYNLPFVIFPIPKENQECIIYNSTKYCTVATPDKLTFVKDMNKPYAKPEMSSILTKDALAFLAICVLVLLLNEIIKLIWGDESNLVASIKEGIDDLIILLVLLISLILLSSYYLPEFIVISIGWTNTFVVILIGSVYWFVTRNRQQFKSLFDVFDKYCYSVQVSYNGLLSTFLKPIIIVLTIEWLFLLIGFKANVTLTDFVYPIIVAPIWEEIIFRGVIFGAFIKNYERIFNFFESFLKNSPWVYSMWIVCGLLMQALFFMFIHSVFGNNPPIDISLFIWGLVYGVIFYFSKPNLTPSIVAHSTHNIFLLLLKNI